MQLQKIYFHVNEELDQTHVGYFPSMQISLRIAGTKSTQSKIILWYDLLNTPLSIGIKN